MTKCQLEDNNYSCAATLTITNGQAIVTLHTDFGLPNGTKIELSKQPEGAVITFHGADGVATFNGHSII